MRRTVEIAALAAAPLLNARPEELVVRVTHSSKPVEVVSPVEAVARRAVALHKGWREHHVRVAVWRRKRKRRRG